MSMTHKAMVLGAGLKEAELALATATEADVLKGKTFYAGSKTLKTGTKKQVTPAFDFSTLGTPTYAKLDGTDLAYYGCSISKTAINLVGHNASSGWGSGKYTFPNKIDVSEYSKIKIHFMGSSNATYTGGDTTYYKVGGKTTAATARSMSICHEIDVSSKSSFTLTVELGWHANNLEAITIHNITFE